MRVIPLLKRCEIDLSMPIVHIYNWDSCYDASHDGDNLWWSVDTCYYLIIVQVLWGLKVNSEEREHQIVWWHLPLPRARGRRPVNRNTMVVAYMANASSGDKGRVRSGSCRVDEFFLVNGSCQSTVYQTGQNIINLSPTHLWTHWSIYNPLTHLVNVSCRPCLG